MQSMKFSCRLGMVLPKIIMLVGLISFVSYLSYKYFTAEPAGYCSAQKRYIPDAEFIRTANALYGNYRELSGQELSGQIKLNPN